MRAIDSEAGRHARRPVRDEHGAISAEFIAVTILVAALVAGLLSLPLAATVADWSRYALCSLFTGECDRPGAHDGDPLEPDLAGCDVLRRTGSLEYSIGVGVTYDNRVGFDTRQFGDGTVQVTYDRNRGATGSVGPGGELWIYTGDDQYGASLGASADLGAHYAWGDVYTFDDLESAEAWSSWQRANAGIVDALPVVGSDMPLVGSAASGLHRGANWLLNQGRHLPFVDEGFGQEPPPDPELVASWKEGGLTVSGSASAATMAGDSGRGELFAAADAVAGAAKQHRIDHRTGERSVIVTTEAWLEGAASAGVTKGLAELLGHGDYAAEGSAGGVSAVELTYDRDDVLIGLTTTQFRLDEAGRDLSGLTDRVAIDRRFGTVSDSGRDGAEDASIYEIRTTLDLRDDAALATTVEDRGHLRVRRDDDVRAALEQATTTVTEHDPGGQRFGGAASIEPVIGEVGGDVSYSRSEGELRDSWYFDPRVGEYRRWTGCVDAPRG